MTAFELWNGKIFLDYLAAVDRGHNCCTSLYTNITVEYFQNLGLDFSNFQKKKRVRLRVSTLGGAEVRDRENVCANWCCHLALKDCKKLGNLSKKLR